MSHLSRSSFIRTATAGASALATIGFVRFPGDAAEFNLKFANDLPPDHPTNIVAKEVADAVAAKSKGRVAIGVFPANQLGNDTQMLSQLRSGAIDMMAIGDNILATLVPAAAINNIGFSWPDSKTAFRALDGDLGTFVRGEIVKAGLQPMNKIWDEGFREMTSSTKPLKTPDDLNGFKMRVPPSPISTALFTALGASPTTINVKDLYSALETHIVDGQENAFALIETQKFYEVQKYCSISNHMLVCYWVLANPANFAKLPKDMQGVVSAAFDDGSSKQREENEKDDNSMRGRLTGQGLQITDVDRNAFKQKLIKAGFYKQMASQFGPAAWGLLEKYAGTLG